MTKEDKKKFQCMIGSRVCTASCIGCRFAMPKTPRKKRELKRK